MGYEVKMFLVEHYDSDETKPTYAGIVGMVDLCKISNGKIAQLDGKRPEAPELYIYAEDGNTRTLEDSYGHNLGVYNPNEVLAALKRDNTPEKYRRYDMAIGLLEATIPVFGDELKVVFYGH
jgi:hypothetical protein